MIDRRQLILLVILLALIGLGLTLFQFFWGWTWNTRMFTFQRLLGELSEPPGWQPESGYSEVSAYSPLGIRSYDVTGTFGDVVDSLRTEAIESGWSLLDEEEGLLPSNQPLPGSYTLTVRQRFSYRERYCLETDFLTDAGELGVQIGTRVVVHMTIYENGQCDRMSVR